jgi:hypothetical protein
MRRGLWILAAIGLAGLIAMAFLGRYYLGSTSGVDETVDLQATLRTAHGSLFEAEPPLRVLRVPGGEGARRTWRWKVDATLRRETDPEATWARSAFDRIASRCAATRVAGRTLDGVILEFRRPNGPPWRREYDGTGAPLRSPGPPGAPK